VYYLSYPHKSMKHWWVVYKVNPGIVIHAYQEENEGPQSISFTVSDRAGLIELATPDVELMEEELGPSNKCKQERRERFNARITEADSDADKF
jgi:hypothetical protein